MKIWSSIWGNIFVRNVLLAFTIILLLIIITLGWLNVYTKHGKAVVIPDVKGLQVQEASVFFEKNALRYEIVDSAYIKNAKPGSIVEMIPQAGTKVKENRIIYLTINAFSTQTLVAPEVKDLSQRQALAMLKAIGFENIDIELVPGAYQDLVVGLQCRNREVSTGERLPIDSWLTLVVSSGSNAEEYFPDSLDIKEGIPDESWF